jgi:hypothetical protein
VRQTVQVRVARAFIASCRMGKQNFVIIVRSSTKTSVCDARSHFLDCVLLRLHVVLVLVEVLSITNAQNADHLSTLLRHSLLLYVGAANLVHSPYVLRESRHFFFWFFSLSLPIILAYSCRFLSILATAHVFCFSILYFYSYFYVVYFVTFDL